MTSDRIKLDRLELTSSRFDLKRVAANAKNRWTAREGILVSARAGGVAGTGEASPLPGFSPESLEDAAAGLDRARERLAGATIELGGTAFEAVERVLAPLGAMPPSARFAVETALFDLRARLLAVPLWRDLGADPAAGPVRLSALLSGETEAEIARGVADALERGISTGKLKVGRPGALSRDVALAEAARRAGGASFRVRLDANGAWTLDEARDALAALAPVGPEIVEEPVGGERWLELGPVGVPLAIDESAAGPNGPRLLEQVLERELCAAVVVKLSAIGGFVAGRRIVSRAAAARRPVIVTHMFEGPVATAAAAAFALALGSRAHGAGLDVHAYADVPDGHAIGRSDVAFVDAPGLGASSASGATFEI